MATGLLMVRTTPAPGQEDEWVRWYRDYFTRMVVSLPSFTRARVLRAVRPANGTGSPNEHDVVCLYEIEADDVRRAVSELLDLEAGEVQRVKVSTAVSRDRVTTEWLYEDSFVTEKSAARDDLEWHGPSHDFESVRDGTRALLGWPPPV